MQVTIYTKPQCRACRFTKDALDKRGIEYTSIDLTEDPELLESIRKEVLSDPTQKLEMPIVRVDLNGGASWTFQGYAPSQIEKLKKHMDGFDPEAAA